MRSAPCRNPRQPSACPSTRPGPGLSRFLLSAAKGKQVLNRQDDPGETGDHPARLSLVSMGRVRESERGEAAKEKPLRGFAVFADEGLEQIDDLLLLAARKLGSGLEHLLQAAFGDRLLEARFLRIEQHFEAYA